MDKVERRILIFTGICHFFTHFTMLIYPPLATTMAKDLGMGLDAVFEVSFAMYLLYGVGAVPWGYFADHWSPRYIMAAGIGVAGFGLLGVGMTESVEALPWFLAIVGLGNAAYHPSGLSLISKGLRTRGRGMGLNGIFGNLGIALAPFAAGVLAWVFGWRTTFSIFGIAGLAAAVAIASVPFSVPRSQDRQKSESIGGRQALTLFLLLCAGVLFAGLVYRTFTLVLPSWLEGSMADQFDAIGEQFAGRASRQSGMDLQSLLAALVSGVAMLIGMGGQLVGGQLADRMDLKKAYVLFFAAAIPCIITGILIPGWASLLFIGLFTFFVLGIQPIENSLYSVLIPPRWRSSGFGIKFTLSFGMGALAVRIVSLSESRIGLDGVMLLAAAYLIMTVAVGLIMLIVGRKTSLKHLH